MGPFSIDSMTQVAKIQIFKDKFSLNLSFNLNNTGLFTLKIGFDDTIKALEWQDLIEKITNSASLLPNKQQQASSP